MGDEVPDFVNFAKFSGESADARRQRLYDVYDVCQGVYTRARGRVVL